jgi:hypothetical protein
MKTSIHPIIRGAQYLTLTSVCAAATFFANPSTALADYKQYALSSQESAGNSNFGGGFSVYAGITQCSADDLEELIENADPVYAMVAQIMTMFGGNADDYLRSMIASVYRCDPDADELYSEIAAEGDAWVEISNYEQSLADIRFAMETVDDNPTTFSQYVSVLGVVVRDKRGESAVTFSYGKSFSKSKSYGFHGFSIKVKANAQAEIGIQIEGSLHPLSYIEIRPTPFATAHATASASVSALCASAGVRGSVDLLDVSVPSRMKLDWSGNPMVADIESDLKYKLPDGSLSVYLDICVDSWDMDIISISNRTHTIGLVDTTVNL